ncbi:fatty acid synthase subunit alpha reductase [Coccidioides immitis RMSCC 2394]|uniref:Fatty acid synthase subunit alpha reductase n=1 Tax=Coccidioides immitis RMSCC 2394 TaxID=404692 RepID=A0A0J6YID4_COCIT|nr:fatty acid synthase subunit alpha reductase [Coccidioides immitis RMSCC 2394]
MATLSYWRHERPHAISLIMSISSAGSIDLGNGVDSRKIAYHLLVELLACVPMTRLLAICLSALLIHQDGSHQFAFPVQWIDTQNVLFDRERSISRLVELGPSNILVNMARRTKDAKFTFQDTLLGIERLFLASTQDSKLIQYQYSTDEQTTASETLVESQATSVSTPELTTSAPSQPPVDRKPSPSAPVANSIPDVPATALEIIQAIIGCKLRKSIPQVPSTKTIKDLAAGKSTLQNEFLADLSNEFGNTPDGAEDLPLNALAESFNSSPDHLGKTISTLISRWVSSTMPARFNLNSIREHLQRRWGLGPGRQTTVVLITMTKAVAESMGQFPSIDAAKELLDTVTSSYAKACGLNLQEQASTSTVPSADIVLDTATLDKLTHEQKRLAMVQHKALASYLGIETCAHRDPLSESDNIHQSRLNLWISEFNEDFERRIQPRFNRRHQRRFNFWWNQVRMDVIKSWISLLSGQVKGQPEVRADINMWRRIANRSNEETIDLVKRLIDHSDRTGEFHPRLFHLGERVKCLIASSASHPPRASFSLPLTKPRTIIGEDGSIRCTEVPRDGFSDYVSLLKSGRALQFASLKTRVAGHWKVKSRMTEEFFRVISRVLTYGISFAGKVALVTGAGPGSIGAELVKGLIMGGAAVIVTTSRAIADSQAYFRKMYAEFGSRGSELYLLPFNQGSMRDCAELIQYIYSPSGLAKNIDILIPFAAIPEKGIEVDGIGAESEFAHRAMLVNVLRLIGPHCSDEEFFYLFLPNHGTFGGDGLYSETKLGLESLLNRISSESWGKQVSLCGVVIGWTRGTGLMESNDTLAETIEAHGGLTFSQEEMPLNILSLLPPDVARTREPNQQFGRSGGNLQRLNGLESILKDARQSLRQRADIAKAIYEEDRRERSMATTETESEDGLHSKDRMSRCTLQMEFPRELDYHQDLEPLKHLTGMVDHSSTVVIVGFSELGPWGSSRTRFEMESQQQLSTEGYIELAWLMGLIKHVDINPPTGHYVGWVDAKSQERLSDGQVAQRFGDHIQQHCGIRIIEPEMAGGYDPHGKESLQEIAVEEDLPEFDATLATATAFKQKHGDYAVIRQLEEPDSFRVQIKAGARIMIPKKSPVPANYVAGQLPSGWTPARYGIPEDIVNQVDPVTLFALCCVSDAFLSAGIKNPMEIFHHIHVSEVGNFIGSSLGGTEKNREMFRDVYLDKTVPGDVLQETNLNTPAAWVNMLLLGSSGPIKTPILFSLERPRCVLLVVWITFHEDEAHAFTMMKATVDTEDQFAQGRTPAEMSRPTAESRGGFVEALGGGVQILCTAELAISMGLPIYAVVSGSAMAADKISRSVPAPGQGVLTFAREAPEALQSPLLNLEYRREKLNASISQLLSGSNDKKIGHDSDDETELLSPTLTPGFVSPSGSSGDSVPDSDSLESYQNSIDGFDLAKESTLPAQINALRRQWGNQFRQFCPTISPMRASLATWGLGIDDIGIVSLHGTSTKANDVNELDALNKQMDHLGRKGPPLLAMCQKSVTGHPKAPAAAWMLNGCLQAMNTGTVPGNFNCDNIDPALRDFPHILVTTETIHVPEINAFLLDSFGFGQKGAQMVGVAPKYLLGTLEKDVYQVYAEKCATRKRQANQAFAHAVMSDSLVKAQTQPPYEKRDESRVLLDPLARVSTNPTSKKIYFDPANLHGTQPVMVRPEQPPQDHITLPEPSPINDVPAAKISISDITGDVLRSLPQDVKIRSIGVDIEAVSTFDYDSNPLFIQRNFTPAEQAFAQACRDPHMALIGRWCAKEAVFKSLGVKSKGAGAPMKEIEVKSDRNGAPKVVLHGAALRTARQANISNVIVSLSYSEGNVIAVAVSLNTPESL